MTAITDRLMVSGFKFSYILQWNLYPSFPYALFSRKDRSFSLVLAEHPCKQCIIISDASFLEVSFSYVNHSEFLVLTDNI
jgi:hypothetical protein